MTPTQVPLIARVLWFLLVGLWAGSIWIVAAWLLNLTLIGLPLGMWMISKLPLVMMMRPQRQRVAAPGTQIAASLAVRAIYFVLIGWWLSLVWLMMAWVAAATVIGLPVAFIMFERTPTITTLSDV